MTASIVSVLPALWGGSTAAAESTPFTTNMQDAGFEHIAHQHGIAVYKDKRADVIRIAAEGRFEAPPAVVMQTLLDYERQVGVLARLAEARIIQRSPTRITVYERINLPMISDRDWVLQVQIGRDREVHWLRFAALPERTVPVRQEVVRVTRNEGSWQLKPLDGGRATFARFQVKIDLAGWVPRWMARASAGKELPEMFLSVCKLLRTPRSCV